MRAGGNQKISKASVNKAVEKEYKQIFNLAVDEITYQIYAIVLTTLDKSYGFRKKRLKKFIKEVEAISKLMVDNPMRGEFDAYKCVDYLKSKYGIDLRQEVKIYE